METKQQKQSLAIPVAIVLAGALIAVGVFMNGRTPGSAVAVGNNAQTTPSDIALKPIGANEHLRGNLDAPIVVVEYSDTECPFCKNFHTTLKTIYSDYGATGQVAWIYRQFPIAQLHPKAPHEAQATECAADQGKFWEYLDQIFAVTPSNNGLDVAQLPAIAKTVGLDVPKFQACLASDAHTADIVKSVSEAQQAGANGTPASYLVLKKALTDKKAQDILALYVQFRLPDGTLPVTINKDKNIVAISGALPYDYIKGTVDIILK